MPPIVFVALDGFSRVYFSKKEAVEIKKQYWILPLLIFILLLIAPLFRWEYTATKTNDYTVYKWKHDRWTGAILKETYDIRPYKNKVIVEYVRPCDRWPYNVDSATNAWYTIITITFTGTVLMWLVPIIKSKRKILNQ